MTGEQDPAPDLAFFRGGVHQHCGQPWHNTARGSLLFRCDCPPWLLFLHREAKAIADEMAMAELRRLVPIADEPPDWIAETTYHMHLPPRPPDLLGVPVLTDEEQRATYRKRSAELNREAPE